MRAALGSTGLGDEGENPRHCFESRCKDDTETRALASGVRVPVRPGGGCPERPGKLSKPTCKYLASAAALGECRTERPGANLGVSHVQRGDLGAGQAQPRVPQVLCHPSDGQALPT